MVLFRNALISKILFVLHFLLPQIFNCIMCMQVISASVSCFIDLFIAIRIVTAFRPTAYVRKRNFGPIHPVLVIQP